MPAIEEQWFLYEHDKAPEHRVAGTNPMIVEKSDLPRERQDSV
jgi:hypothetical protein